MRPRAALVSVLGRDGGTGQPSRSVTLAGAVPAGGTLIVACGAAGAQAVADVSDGGGRAYTRTAESTAGTTWASWWRAAGPVPAGTAVTAQWPVNVNATVLAFAVDGPFDAAGTVSEPTSTIRTQSSTVTAARAGTAVAHGMWGAASSDFEFWAGTLPWTLDDSYQAVAGSTLWSRLGSAAVPGPGPVTATSSHVANRLGRLVVLAFGPGGPAEPPPQITIPAPLPAAQAGVPWALPLTADDGTPPLSWAVSGLPAGLAVHGDQVSGTPAAAGTHSLAFTVTDQQGRADTATRALVVAARLEITSELPDARIGDPYDAMLEAAGGVPPYTWAVSGLPAGLGLDADRVTGTPAAPGG